MLAVNKGAQVLVSSSGGNAGLATAYAGRRLQVKVIVVIPESTPSWVADSLKSYGAEAVVYGSQWCEANQRAIQIVEEKNGALIHPFEGEETWRGHSTLVDEIAE